MITIQVALRICTQPEHLRRTIRIALVVGTILTLINQADVIAAGDAVTSTWIKAGANYIVPFIVSNLGLLAGKRAEAESPPPPVAENSQRREERSTLPG